jgi:hypothetical protein
MQIHIDMLTLNATFLAARALIQVNGPVRLCRHVRGPGHGQQPLQEPQPLQEQPPQPLQEQQPQPLQEQCL